VPSTGPRSLRKSHLTRGLRGVHFVHIHVLNYCGLGRPCLRLAKDCRLKVLVSGCSSPRAALIDQAVWLPWLRELPDLMRFGHLSHLLSCHRRKSLLPAGVLAPSDLLLQTLLMFRFNYCRILLLSCNSSHLASSHNASLLRWGGCGEHMRPILGRPAIRAETTMVRSMHTHFALRTDLKHFRPAALFALLN
jgi:hypothetical protein